jgi:hypothetical protein
MELGRIGLPHHQLHKRENAPHHTMSAAATRGTLITRPHYAPQILDYNFFACLTAMFGSTTGDFKRARVQADAALSQQMGAS